MSKRPAWTTLFLAVALYWLLHLANSSLPGGLAGLIDQSTETVYVQTPQGCQMQTRYIRSGVIYSVRPCETPQAPPAK